VGLSYDGSGLPNQVTIGFVDAGYLQAEGARAIGAHVEDARINPAELVAWLRRCTFPTSEGFRRDLLRLYWYDGAYDHAHERFAAQRRYFNAIAATPGIQLRPGHLQPRPAGWQRAVKRALQAIGTSLTEFDRHFTFRRGVEQKGVDTLIVLDMVRLAERGAYDMAVLVSGDRDIAEAARVAQDTGRRVAVAKPQAGHGLSTELAQLADAIIDIPEDDMRRIIQVRSS
jgi:uncharacterized LabA/DUF88 family protein